MCVYRFEAGLVHTLCVDGGGMQRLVEGLVVTARMDFAQLLCGHSAQTSVLVRALVLIQGTNSWNCSKVNTAGKLENDIVFCSLYLQACHFSENSRNSEGAGFDLRDCFNFFRGSISFQTKKRGVGG